MRISLTDRKDSQKVTDAAVFVIDAIQRKRKPGLITDVQLSRALGAADQTVHYWRKGKRAITIDQLCAMVQKFNVNANFLIKQEGSPWGEAELSTKLYELENRQQEMELRLTELEKTIGKKTGKKQSEN